MIALMWMTLVAQAEVPDDVRPVLAPLDTPEQFAAYLASAGGSGVLACEPFWPQDALMCWKYGAGQWATRADLREWGVTHDDLVATATARAREQLAAGWTEVTVDGMQGSYFTAPDPDGLAHAAVLVPDVVAGVTGGRTLYVAAPAEGVLLAWSPGRPELDHVIAVGVRKMFDDLPGGASPVVYRYTGAWSPFAEASPRTPPM